MGSIFVVVALLLGEVVFASPLLKYGEETDDEPNLKIVNGNFSTIDQHPITVAFLIANNIWGAGAIIDGMWILTTAFNCFWVEIPYITVRSGSSNWTSGGVVISAEKCVIHPDYTGTWANNIALLKLTQKIPLGSKNAEIGYYQTPDTLKVPNKTYDVTGWGVRSSSYQKETQVQNISQTIMNDEDCSKFYNLTAATGSFCASNANGGPCVFDFGAPMNYKRYVVGLYQGSIDCTKPEIYPALYVDIYPYIDWIANTISQ